MKPYILVDISFLAHRARFACDEFEYHDFKTGVLFGFWEQLKSICDELHSTKVLLCFDSKKSHRKNAFPEYKAKRTAELTEEEQEQLRFMYEQIRLLRDEWLPAIGFPVYRQSGLESDDLMAQAALQLSDTGRENIIVTADGDLWQCISPFTSWYDPARKKRYTPETFKADKGVTPKDWAAVKSLAGCSGDGVPGIPGVGEKTAIKYLLGKLPDYYKTFQAIESIDGAMIQQRNAELVVLPHRMTKPLRICRPAYNPDEFFRMCKRYGFASYLRGERHEEWIAFFNGGKRSTRKPKNAR